ncbi:MAG: V-type ATPase subunit [Planctomycetota bacterium]
MAPKSEDSTWSFASGRAAVLESWMVPRDFFEHIIRGPREDIYTRLADTLIGDRFSHGDDLRDSESVFRQFYQGLIGELTEQSPDPYVGNLLLWRKDLRSLKNHLKRFYFGVDVSEVSSRQSPEKWDQVRDEPYAGLPRIFRRTFNRACLRANPSECSAQVFDAAFDSAVVRELRREAEHAGSEWIGEYWRRFDAIRGVEFLLRGEALDLDGEVLDLLLEERAEPDLLDALREAPVEDRAGLLAGALDGFEVENLADMSDTERIREVVHAGDQWLMDYVREGSLMPFGPERVFACMIGLEAEGLNMSMAVVGRANELEPEHLDRHLKPCYV